MEEAFPYYLAIGMTYDEYWNASPALVSAYRKAHRLHIQEKNEQMYLQGAYNFIAFETALSNLNLDGKHRKHNDYLKEPLRILQETKAEREAKIREEQRKVADYFNGIIAAQEARKAKEHSNNGT